MNRKLEKNTLFLLLLSASNSFASEQKASSYKTEFLSENDKCSVSAYYFQRGNVPLFLSNEHGADKFQVIPGVPLRNGIGVKGFVNKADWKTADITLKVAQEFQRITGKKPYVLIAKIHRSQIDFNRPAKFSYESFKLKACYDDFHRVAKATVDEINQRWGQGYLVDVHGQNKYPDHLIRGTQNGLTVTQLRQQEGNEKFQGKSGLFGLLAGLNYQVMPRFLERETVYAGGYMVKTYGSHNPAGIDAIQVEIGKSYRKDLVVREQFILDFAKVLAERISYIFKE